MLPRSLESADSGPGDSPRVLWFVAGAPETLIFETMYNNERSDFPYFTFSANAFEDYALQPMKVGIDWDNCSPRADF